MAVVAIVVMAVITGVATRSELLALAVIGGGALGVAQGAALRVEAGERGLMARRSPIGLGLWGAGIVVMQVGGFVTRTGAIQIGQTLAVFSAAMGIGLLLGRRGPMARARSRSATGRALAGAVAATFALVVLVGVGAWWAPGRADAEGEITYQGTMAVASRPLLKPYYLDSSDVRLVVADRDVSVTLSFTLVAALRVTGTKATCTGTMSRRYAGRAAMASSVTVPLSLTGSANALSGDCRGVAVPVVATQTLTGTFSDDGRFVGSIRGVWSVTAVRTSGGASSPSAGTTSPPVQPSSPPAPSVTAPPTTVGPEPVVEVPPGAAVPGEDVTPEEATASAAVGLLGAAAIGLIILG